MLPLPALAALALTAAPPVAAAAPVAAEAAVAAEAPDCAGALAEARQTFHDHATSRARFVAPLEQAMRHVIERALDDEDEVLVHDFSRGEVSAAKLDAALWPKLRPELDRFNRAGCRELGGVVAAEDARTDVVAARAGTSVHTAVVVTCARSPLQGETRRFLGLRIRRGEAGPQVSLHGFIQARVTADAEATGAEWSGVVVDVPLGDRARGAARLAEALASWSGSEDDFTWTVPARCMERVSALDVP